MAISPRQRRVLLQVLGAAMSALVLLGGFHYHDGELGKVCWYCFATGSAMLPAVVAVVAASVAMLPRPAATPDTLAPLPWVTPHRRGPPVLA